MYTMPTKYSKADKPMETNNTPFNQDSDTAENGPHANSFVGTFFDYNPAKKAKLPTIYEEKTIKKPLPRRRVFVSDPELASIQKQNQADRDMLELSGCLFKAINLNNEPRTESRCGIVKPTPMRLNIPSPLMKENTKPNAQNQSEINLENEETITSLTP